MKKTEVIDAKTAKHLDALAKIHKPLKTLVIKSKVDVEIANDRIHEIGTSLKEIEADKKEIVVPLKKVTKALDARYKAMRDPLQAEDRILKGAIDKYLATQTQKRVVAAVKKAEKRGLDTDFAAKQAAFTRPDNIEGLKTKNVVEFEVTDIKLVPAYIGEVEIRELKRGPINALIRADPKMKIPGLRIVQKQVVTR